MEKAASHDQPDGWMTQRKQRQASKWRSGILIVCGQILVFLVARNILDCPPLHEWWSAWPLWRLPVIWPSHPPPDTLEVWIHKEASFAWQKIFQQIGPPAGADEGLVIASPSIDEPDYFYTWTRDSALVTSVALDHLRRFNDTSVEPVLREYAYSQHAIQRVCNPSGCFEGGLRGLGEPKYHVNGTAFVGQWGRPQRDGPALRAITLIGFADYLMTRGTSADLRFIRRHLYEATLPAESVIKVDLEYIARYWDDESFDLWEEINGKHFFTLLSSQVALERGARLAAQLLDRDAAQYYIDQSDKIKKALRKFIDADTGRIHAYENPRKFERSGLDAAVPLGVLVAGTAGVEEWGPADDHVLITLKYYVDSFRHEYKINPKEGPIAVATGRYAEDIYDGVGLSIGNPWYLTTLSVAHVLTRTLMYYRITPAEILISSVSRPFWAQFDKEVSANEIVPVRSKRWWKLLDELEAWMDGFWTVVRTYEGEGGQLSEQFHRDTGMPVGAKNLTWSYAAFYLAYTDRLRYKAGIATRPEWPDLHWGHIHT